MKLHNDQMMRNRNFRVRNDVVERGSVTQSQKDTKPALRGKWESVFSGKHTDNVPKETHVVSVMTFWPLETRAKVSDEKGDQKSKKGGAKGSVAILMESFQLGCVSQESYPRNSILREPGKLEIKTRRQLLQGHLAPNENSGKKRSIARNHPKVCAS